MADALLHQLRTGVEAMSLSCDEDQLLRLLSYINLIERWNKAYNLTAIRDPSAMIVRHLLDSLAVLPFLGEQPILDVGTGAGLPGVPIAIAKPNVPVALLDSNGKKTRFLFQVKTQLALTNIALFETRVEHYQPTTDLGVIISRAFANLTDMVRHCLPLLPASGRLLAMKGPGVDAELELLLKDNSAVTLVDCHNLSIPGLDEARYLVELTHKTKV